MQNQEYFFDETLYVKTSYQSWAVLHGRELLYLDCFPVACTFSGPWRNGWWSPGTLVRWNAQPKCDSITFDSIFLLRSDACTWASFHHVSLPALLQMKDTETYLVTFKWFLGSNLCRVSILLHLLEYMWKKEFIFMRASHLKGNLKCSTAIKWKRGILFQLLHVLWQWPPCICRCSRVILILSKSVLFIVHKKIQLQYEAVIRYLIGVNLTRTIKS